MTPMAKTIRELSHRHGTYNVFADFCEMSAIAFSNVVDKRQYKDREERYMRIVKKYEKEEANKIGYMLGMLTMEMEKEPRDVMGELFHELELHNEHAGQFFTPYNICRMMADMTFDDNAKSIVEKRGYITAHEPACGSGAMVIALADSMYMSGINYQQALHVTAVDIDSRCVHMAYTQFSLMHIPAIVYAGDTLSMEMRDVWYTPAHIIGNWDYKLKKSEFQNDAKYIVSSDTVPKQEPIQAQKPALKNVQKKGENPMQLTLF